MNESKQENESEKKVCKKNKITVSVLAVRARGGAERIGKK